MTVWVALVFVVVTNSVHSQQITVPTEKDCRALIAELQKQVKPFEHLIASCSPQYQ